MGGPPWSPAFAAGLAVLAGIAGSEAMCARRLGEIHRGEDHRAAAPLLAEATPAGRKRASTFLRLVDIKDEAHARLLVLAPQRARSAVRWGQHIIDCAREELQR